MAIWRAYELMESQAGNFKAAQNVYQRSIRDAIVKGDYPDFDRSLVSRKNHIYFLAMKSYISVYLSNPSPNHSPQQNKARDVNIEPPIDDILKESNEVEVSRWSSKSDAGFGGRKREVWLNDGSIEGKVPKSAMRKKSNKPVE
jgi:hypothetical protein